MPPIEQDTDGSHADHQTSMRVCVGAIHVVDRSHLPHSKKKKHACLAIDYITYVSRMRHKRLDGHIGLVVVYIEQSSYVKHIVASHFDQPSFSKSFSQWQTGGTSEISWPV